MVVAERDRSLALAQFGVQSSGCLLVEESCATYWYEGRCPRTGSRLRLPRTALAERVARGLSAQLSGSDLPQGKMYGVLLVESPEGCRVLKAFSGQSFEGKSDWVPAIPNSEQLLLSEFQAIAALEAIKQELAVLAQLPARQAYDVQAQIFSARLSALAERHRQRKESRRQRRQEVQDQRLLEALDEESRRDGIERRHLKRARDRILAPLKQAIAEADAQVQALKRRRKQLSRQLQTQMHAAYTLTNFAGERLALSDVVPHQAMPTGTGKCCAPKLLHYAATHGLTPLAMAEFWWGDSADGSRVSGAFYGACPERCQPIMGFLLSGLPPVEPTPAERQVRILYEDQWLIAIAKPAGLLSTPGRSVLHPDSAVSQVQAAVSGGVYSVHRLDQATSGILLFARSPQTHRQISEQFRQRRVDKRYEALVTAAVEPDQGSIQLPIGRYRDYRPKRRVDWDGGKPSHTQFTVLERRSDYKRLELFPLTGRTHQLRVHLASPEGLGAPILGDRLYGGEPSDRLHLHARELKFWHPERNQRMHLVAETPF